MTQNQPQTPEAPKEDLRLDKFKNALNQLREQVDSLTEFRVIEDRLKTAFMKDVREELEISEEESENLWAQAREALTTNKKWQEILKEKVAESAEKSALDAYVDNVENYDAIKTAIERKGGEGMIKQFIGFLKEKWDNSKWVKKYGIEWAAITGWFGKMFIEYADAGEKKLEADKAKKGFVFSSAWKSPFYSKLKSIGEWLESEKKEPEKPEEKQGEKPEEKAPEKKYEKEVQELKSLCKLHELNFSDFSNVDYERVLKDKKFGNDPSKLKNFTEKTLVSKLSEFQERLGNHTNKKLQKQFRFKLNDLLIAPGKWEHATKALTGEDDKYEIPKLAHLDPESLRHFLDAVRIDGSTVKIYEKPKEEKPKEEKPTKNLS